MTELEAYVDIEELLPMFEWQECWNCGHQKRVRTDRPPWKVCHECFMGQQKVDPEHRGDSTTEEGYTDYRILWYGDVSIEEAKEQYRENTKDIRERHERMEARERTVRV